MKKNKTKSILTCAVLASVLAGGMLPVQAASADEVSKNTVSVQRDKVVSGELRKVENGAQTYAIPGMTVQELINTSLYAKPSVQHDNILVLDPQDYTGWQSFIWGAELGWVGGGMEIAEKEFYYEEPSSNAKARTLFVYNNELTIKSGSFLKDVYGATDYYNPVFYNTINILGDTVISGNVYGGRARRRLEGNKVNITDGVTIGGNVYGGYTDENHYVKIIVEVEGSSVDSTAIVVEDTYKLISNEVNLSGNVTVAGNVYGGYSSAERRDFDGNVVSLNDRATVAGNVYGAWEYRADDGYKITINNNVVNINNEATADKVYGGYLKLGEKYSLGTQDEFGTIKGNVVNLRGGQVDTVYGVYIDTVGNRDKTQATDNIVNLYSTKVNNIFGAYQANETGFRATGLLTATGNKLNIFSVGNTVEKLGGFQEFNFVVPSGVVPGGTAMLTLADRDYKVKDDGENINAQAVFATNTLKRGDAITLVVNHRGWIDFFPSGSVQTSTDLDVGFDLYAYTGQYLNPGGNLVFQISKGTPVPGEYCITVDGANISNIYGTDGVQYGAVQGTHYYNDSANKTFYTKKYNDSWKNWLTVDLKENTTYDNYSWYGVKTEGADAHGVLNMKSGNAKVVSGGYASDSEDASGDASGNHVILQGGTVTDVYGGIATTGNATDNNIHLLGGTVTNIHGGKNNSGITTGNTLTTYTFGNTISLVDGVNNLNFIVADRNLQQPMLTISDGPTDISNLNIQVGVVTPELYGSDVIRLLHYENGIGTLNLPERLLADEDWQNTGAKVNQDVVSEISKALEEKYAVLTLDGLVNYKAKFVVDEKNIYLTIDTDSYDPSSCDPEDFKIVVDENGTPRSAGELYDVKYSVKDTDFFVKQTPKLEWERELTIYGGYDNKDNISYYAAKEESRDAAFGTITLAGGTVKDLYAGHSADGNVYENKAVVTGGTVSNVYGGYSTNGEVHENRVAVSGGTVSGNLYGGYGTNGEIHENRVAVNGVTVNGSVYGGYSTNGKTYENEVTVSGGTVDNLYGGWSGGDSYNNRVILENKATVINGNLYGSYSTNGTANHNTLILKEGTVKGNVYAGYKNKEVTENTYRGETGYNTVHLFNTKIEGELSGGNFKAYGGNFDNKLYVYNTNTKVDELSNFQQINLIVPDGQKANEITMLSVTKKYAPEPGELSIDIQVGIVDKNLQRNAVITLLKYEDIASSRPYSYSGYSAAQIDGVLEGTPGFVQYKGTYIGNAEGVYFCVESNADIPADFCITVDGDNVTTGSGLSSQFKYDYDDRAFSMKVNSNPKNWANELILNLEKTTLYPNTAWYGVKVKAADLEANPDAKDAHGILRMNNGTARFLAGGYGSDRGSNANYNEVYLNGGELVNPQGYNTAIYGGDAPYGEANYNKVYLKGGTVQSGEIYGGYSNSKGASYNSVYLQGTIVNGNNFYGVIYGGSNSINTPKDSLNDVVGNHVYLQKGSVNKVYAGYSGNNFARDNTVDLDPDPNGNLTVNEIYGSDRADNGVNNTLNVLNANSNQIITVANFQNIDFTLPMGNISNITQMLNVANAVDLNNVAVHVYLNGQEPDSITLINKVVNNGVYSVYTGAGAGAELTKDYTISVAEGKVVLKADAVLWYTIGTTEYKYKPNDTTVKDINNNVTGDVTIYRGTAYDNQMQGNKYGDIDATGHNVTIDSKNPLTVTGKLTANTVTGGLTAKTVMINADRTLIMNSGATLTTTDGVTNSGTLNVNAEDLKSDVTNNGTVNLGAGTSEGDTLAPGSTITGGTLNINGNVTANAGDIMGNTNMVAENKILTLNGGSTIAKTISGAGTLDIAANMSVNADNLQTSTTLVDSGKTLTITGGTFDKRIGGDGTLNITGTLHFGNNAELVQTGTQAEGEIPVSGVSVILAKGGTFDVRDRENTTGGCINTLTFDGGRIDASGGHVGNLLVVDNLNITENGGSISFDVSATDNDKIGVLTSVASGSKLNLDSINVVGELSGVVDPVSGYSGSIDFVQDLSGNSILTNLTISGTTTTMSGNYMYTFTPGNNGTLNYTKAMGMGLMQVIQAKDINGQQSDDYGKVDTYSFTGDRGKNFEPYSQSKLTELGDGKTDAENLNKRFGDLGVMGHANGVTSRTLTIVGNGSELSGGTYEGVTVGNGDTLVLKNIGAITDAENNIIATNNGTVKFTGSGTTDVRATITGGGKLIVEGVNVVLGENYQYVTGRQELTAQELAELKTKVDGGTATEIEQKEYDYGWKLNDDGSYVTTLSETTSAKIAQTDLEILSGSLTANADNIRVINGIVDNGELVLVGGKLDQKVTGTGNLTIDGNVSTNADYIDVSGKNTVNAGRTLTLLGGTLNKVIGGKGNVTIGNGTNAVTMAVDLNLFTNTGNLTVADNSTLQTNVAVNRKINGNGTVELIGNVTITDRVEINRLATNGNIITVGNDSKAGYVDAKEIQLKGGMIFLDPIWKNGVGVEGATHVATQTANLDGAYVVGRNSILTFGTTNENGDVQFKLSGLKWGQNDISAATYVAKNINVSGGSLTIDGSLIAPPTAPTKGTVNMAANSLLMVKGDICGTNAAVSGITGTDIKEGANLYVTNVQEETVYKIMTGNNIAAQNLTTLLPYGYVLDEEKVISNGNEVTIQFKLDRDAGQDTVIPNVIKNRDGELKKYVGDVSDNYVGNVEKVTNEINSYANFAENLGVTRGAYDVANMVGDAINGHWDNREAGENLWVVYAHNKEKVDGLSLGGGMKAKYDGKYDTLSLGLDLNDGFGLLFNYADGNVSNGLGHNDMEQYGLGVYARQKVGKFAIQEDLNYLYGKNELKHNSANTQITADAKTDTISLGVTAELPYQVGKGRLTPFAGVRYINIDGRSYTDSLGVNREADKVNMVVAPIGVKFDGKFALGDKDWSFRPYIAAGYAFNFGDRENDVTLSYNGAADTFGYDVADSNVFFTKAGLEFSKKNLTLGLGYDYMKSSNTDNNKWNFNMNYNFGNSKGLPYKSVLLGKIDLLENANKELRAENVELKSKVKTLEAENERLKMLLAEKSKG